ncbi:MAG: 2-amino-4-hydroxy-6-hydroxymethyldihydropteridine diphosphokinase [Gemmatimonadaceae bacterium]
MSIDVAYIALGSNVGDREAQLAAARRAMASLPGARLIAESSVEETPPLGNVPQGAYLNQMVALETPLAPRALLDALQAIERAAGRTREVRWGPRTIDLDIVRFASTTAVSEPGLTVPHPELAARDFWRRELAELEARA